MIDFTRSHESEADEAFGPYWSSLGEYDKIVVEAMTEGDSDYLRLAVALELAVTDERQRTIAACMKHFAEWVHSQA